MQIGRREDHILMRRELSVIVHLEEIMKENLIMNLKAVHLLLDSLAIIEIPITVNLGSIITLAISIMKTQETRTSMSHNHPCIQCSENPGMKLLLTMILGIVSMCQFQTGMEYWETKRGGKVHPP